MKLCIIVSNFYPKISNLLIEGATKELKKRKIKNFKIIFVDGTFEIPMILTNLVKKYNAFIVLGCVIKGKTPHFEFLCSSVFNSLINLSVSSKIPIGNGILTCNNIKQAIERANPKKLNKGGAAVSALLNTIKVINKWIIMKHF